jgi:iron complex outermembrane recepter protein
MVLLLIFICSVIAHAHAQTLLTGKVVEDSTGDPLTGANVVLVKPVSDEIEEVVVTAEKRAQSLQDIPFSISIIESDALRTMHNIADLQYRVPNLFIPSSALSPTNKDITLRGMSSTNYDDFMNPSVGLIRNGSSSRLGGSLMFDNLEGVEVTRGSTGSLFSSSDGVINLVDKTLSREAGGDLHLSYDEKKQSDFTGNLNVPFSDRGGVNIYGTKISDKKGQLDDEKKSQQPDIEQYGLFSQFEVSDNLRFAIRHQSLQDRSKQGIAANSGAKYTHEDNKISQFRTFYQWDQDAYLNYNYQRQKRDSDNQLYYRRFNQPGEDIGGLGEDIGEFGEGIGELPDHGNNNNANELIGESMLIGRENTGNSSDHAFNIAADIGGYRLTGGFILSSNDRHQFDDIHQSSTSAFRNGKQQEEESRRVQLRVDGQYESFEFQTGLTWLQQEKTFTGSAKGAVYDPSSGQTKPALKNPEAHRNKEDALLPYLAALYFINDESNIYMNYSESYNSGGFFSPQYDHAQVYYQPEKGKQIEIGSKNTLLDGSMRLNMAAFHNTFQDKQQALMLGPTPAHITTVVRNADMTSRGFELTIQTGLSDSLVLNASYGYTDVKYTRFLADITGDGVMTDNTHLTPPNAPKHTFGLRAQHTHDLGTGSLHSSLMYRYRDKLVTDYGNDPRLQQDAAHYVGARIEYFNDDYTVAVYGDNLTNEREQTWSLIPGLAANGVWNEGRTIGLDVGYSF